MTSSEVAKLVVAIILGIMTEFLWSHGFERMAFFILATMFYQIFFITAEKKK